MDLAAPADPSRAYDARPLGYFRWLFELRELAGSAEAIAALVAPAIVGGYLVALPLLDRGSDRSPRQRIVWLGGLAGLLAVIGALSVMSFVRDSADPELAKRGEAATRLAARARELAQANGVPATGAQDIWTTAPMWRARTIFERKCSGCHVDDKDRKGPLIVPGHGNRAWIKAVLEHPSADEFWGRTDLVANAERAQLLEGTADKPANGPQDLAMKPVGVTGADLDDLVELLYAQSGAPDVNKTKRERGARVFEGACTDCHNIGEGVAGTAGPGLGGLGSRDWYTSFVSNPKAAIHMTEDMSQMPRFDKELSLIERDLVAEYLVWLRTATPADLAALGPARVRSRNRPTW